MHLLSTKRNKLTTKPGSSAIAVDTRLAEVARVVTIGNFDGVHRGHQAILKQLAEMASEQAAVATVITFEPYPEEYFRPAKAPARLSRFAEKYRLLQKFSVAEIACLRFNQSLSGYSPREFVDEILIKKLNTKHLIVGDDFKFGHNRAGDFAFLQEAGGNAGFTVTPTASVCENGIRISSTRVREALQNGEFTLAKKLLGHHYFITARVMHGDKRGRTLGFPTANLALARKNSVLQGVYAVTANFAAGSKIHQVQGVANVGMRPTVSSTEPRAEIHLFDFDKNLYGKKLTVNFLHKIRDEEKFSDLRALTTQIQQDCILAKAFHSKNAT